MSDWIPVVVGLFIYVVVMKWLLPRLGVPT